MSALFFLLMQQVKSECKTVLGILRLGTIFGSIYWLTDQIMTNEFFWLFQSRGYLLGVLSGMPFLTVLLLTFNQPFYLLSQTDYHHILISPISKNLALYFGMFQRFKPLMRAVFTLTIPLFFLLFLHVQLREISIILLMSNFFLLIFQSVIFFSLKQVTGFKLQYLVGLCLSIFSMYGILDEKSLFFQLMFTMLTIFLTMKLVKLFHLQIEDLILVITADFVVEEITEKNNQNLFKHRGGFVLFEKQIIEQQMKKQKWINLNFILILFRSLFFTAPWLPFFSAESLPIPTGYSIVLNYFVTMYFCGSLKNETFLADLQSIVIRRLPIFFFEKIFFVSLHIYLKSGMISLLVTLVLGIFLPLNFLTIFSITILFGSYVLLTPMITLFTIQALPKIAIESTLGHYVYGLINMAMILPSLMIYLLIYGLFGVVLLAALSGVLINTISYLGWQHYLKKRF